MIQDKMSEPKVDTFFERVVQRFEPESKLLKIFPLKEGRFGYVTVIEIARANGGIKKMVVRRHGEREISNRPNVAAEEFQLLQQLNRADISAPRPYCLDISCEIFPTPYIVMEYLEGIPQFSQEKALNYATQAAQQLAKIHCIADTSLNLFFLPKQSNSLAERFSRRPIPTKSSEATNIQKILQQIGPLCQRNKPTLLHGDFWPGNLLWQEDRLIATIDWEDAKIGEPLEDFAISRFDICFIFGIEAMNLFTQQYQLLSPIDFSHLPYWDLYAALRASFGIEEWAEGWAALGRADLTEKVIREAHRWFIEQAFEKLEMR